MKKNYIEETALMGNRIKKIREVHGYSRQALAKAMSISNDALRKWENGKNTIPILSAVAIANFFNIDINTIVGNIDIGGKKDMCDFTISLIAKLNSTPMWNLILQIFIHKKVEFNISELSIILSL